jgi:hypothetical protein
MSRLLVLLCAKLYRLAAISRGRSPLYDDGVCSTTKHGLGGKDEATHDAKHGRLPRTKLPARVRCTLASSCILKGLVELSLRSLRPDDVRLVYASAMSGWSPSLRYAIYLLRVSAANPEAGA